MNKLAFSIDVGKKSTSDFVKIDPYFLPHSHYLINCIDTSTCQHNFLS